MNNKSDPIVVIESRGAQLVAANGYKDEDAWLDAIAAYALAQCSDLDIQTQADAVAYLADKRNVGVKVITQVDYLDTEDWDLQVIEAAAALGWTQAIQSSKKFDKCKT